MSVAGYVLAGGNSTRMGTDKALLDSGGIALAQRIAAIVRKAAGNATLVGSPDKYGSLGFAVIPDLRTGLGPLAGMEAALRHSASEWNLIVACDMASLRAEFLETLCAEALKLPSGTDCLVPVGPDQRPQPLSALYRRRCLTAFSEALDRNQRRVTDIFESLHVFFWPTADAKPFQNVNTPEDWNRYLHG
jgi:molybdopterin-guanine dinucleotide biosynthesis protein A